MKTVAASIAACTIALSVGLAESVTSLTLINADSDGDLATLHGGATLNLALLPTRNLNVRANTSPATVGSVKFGLDGNAEYRVESTAPYALAGDTGGNYNPWTPGVGAHELTVTPYTEAGAAGTTGTALTVNFTVIDDASGEPTNQIPAGLYGELRKWHKVSIVFDGPDAGETNTTNPFLDYRLNVSFSHTGSGKSYVVPGHYAADGRAAESGVNSGRKWRIHFAPDETGTWNYTASFRSGSQIAVDDDPAAGLSAGHFDGETGSFEITATDKTGRDHRGKGRLQYVGEHYLRFAETHEYFLKQGADSPENLLAYDDIDNTPDNGGRRKSWAAHVVDWNTGDPVWRDNMGKGLIGAINYLASEGMNAFSFLTMNIGGDDNNVFPYVGNLASDRTRFDCSKLDQWEIILEHGDHMGMYLHFKTQETENDQLLDSGALGVERRIYYRELISRFAHHLALNWNLGEENTNTEQQRKDFAQYFYDHDPYRHNIVLHTYPGDKIGVYTPLLGTNSRLTGLSLQSDWNSVDADIDYWVRQSAATGCKWVVANDEQGSAGEGIKPDSANDHDGRRKETLWGCLLSGGAGNEYYFGYDYEHSDLTCQDFRSRDLWWDYCRYALEFFKTNNIPFRQMINDNSKSTAAADYCFYKSNEVYVICLKDGGTTSLDLSGVVGAFDVGWYDPRNGGALRSGTQTTVEGGTIQPLGNSPDSVAEDWVLLVTRDWDADSDGDGMSDGDEVVAGTNPGDRDSVLRLSASELHTSISDFVVRWQSVSNRVYTLQAAGDLADGFSLILRTNILATAPENVHTDSVGNAKMRFYRVEVGQEGR